MTQQLMERQHTRGSHEAGVHSGFSAWVSGLARELAVIDWFVGAYLVVVLVAVLLGTGAGKRESVSLVLADMGLFTVGVVLTRGAILTRGTVVSQLVYRLTLMATLLASYVQLRVILPAVSPRAIDAQILAFDLRVFHVEPSLAWDAFVTPRTTEWFAFFYFAYFFVLAAHVFPFLIAVRQTKALARFALGIFVLFCSGHLLYMVVPGYGPYRFLAGEFVHELSGGTFWGLVKEAVAGAGAQKDIFPSLHTAVPTFLLFFELRNRRQIPIFRYTWPIQAFVTTQIIVATMFLRWHYLIDIFAGLTLAVVTILVTERAVEWETRHRARAGIPPAWVPLPWSRPIEPSRLGSTSVH
jgi:hypothetical protein